MQVVQRFIILDAMRGIAAMAVVIGHITGVIGGVEVFPNAVLAVAFFFMLSGFVLSHAYRRGIDGTGGLLKFAKQRLIRLFPLIVLGALIGSMHLGYRYLSGRLEGVPGLHVVVAQLLSFTTLPSPFLSIDGWRWPVNHPQWSLFYELIASAALALVLLRLNKLALLVITAAGIIVFGGMWQLKGELSPGIVGHLSLTVFAFTLGCLAYRLYSEQRLPVLRLPALATLLLLVTLFNPVQMSFALHMVTLLLAIPLIVCCSLNTVPSERTQGVMEYLGEFSYPIYVLHWPLMLVIRDFLPDLGLIGITFVTLAVVAALSHAALVYYDIPLRRYLREKYLQPARSPAGKFDMINPA